MLPEPMKPFRVIRELKKQQEEATTANTNDEGSGASLSDQLNPRDEFGYPRANMEHVLKYYQDHPDERKAASPDHFAIIVGSNNYSSEYINVVIFDLGRYHIKDVIATEGAVIFLAENGVCYCLLSEESGWTSRLTNVEEINGEIAYPVTFSLEDPIEKVFAREDLIFVTKSEKLIFWRRAESLEFQPQQFDFEKIIDIALGDGHVVFLSESGNVFGYGTNTAGQLANSIHHDSRYCRFNISHIPDRIVKVYATYNTTLALTESGHVYSCGDSSYGAHGHDESSVDYNREELCKINFPHRVVDIYPGLFFVALRTIQDEYYVFGYNNMSQFGYSSTIGEKINGPHYLDTFGQENIDSLSCGGYHSLIVTKDKRVYISGWSIGHDCFPSKEGKYHFIDVNTILGKSALPSYSELYATSGLYFLLIHSKLKSANRFNFRKSYKICDISFNFDCIIEPSCPAFMSEEY